MQPLLTYQIGTPRPLGVWLLTLLNVPVSGIMPLVAGLTFFRTGHPTELLPIGVAAFQIVLGAVILWACLGTWQGNPTARDILLSNLIAFQTLQLINNVALVLFAGVAAGALPGLMATALYSLFWICLNRWYFRRPQTRMWYYDRSAPQL